MPENPLLLGYGLVYVIFYDVTDVIESANTNLQDFYQTTRSQTLMPGTHRVFRSIEQYHEARATGMGTKMNAVLKATQHFLATPCASVPKIDKTGSLLPEAEQDAPYRTEPWDVPDKLLLYTKFTMNFPLIISVSH